MFLHLSWSLKYFNKSQDDIVCLFYNLCLEIFTFHFYRNVSVMFISCLVAVREIRYLSKIKIFPYRDHFYQNSLFHCLGERLNINITLCFCSAYALFPGILTFPGIFHFVMQELLCHENHSRCHESKSVMK